MYNVVVCVSQKKHKNSRFKELAAITAN